ncbi:nucleoid-associated protein [uncultured Maribacter sp.]|uniref:nucleoid-associated protein n=1 Tax=uncultured Maribacter sp. TaxID=431308 RepID=UPI002627D431|nr:nucleoid-associated protein [uncultured Maribacter sp.]
MSIAIQRIIVHFLEKQPKSSLAKIESSKKLLEVDEFAEKLVSELHESISTSPSLKNATFKEGETNLFTNTLKEYLDSENDNNFITFSNSLSLLREKVEKEFFAKGGYYLFCDYSISKDRYLAIVLLRKKSGINIIKDGELFKLDSSENINIEKIAMATRINHNIYKSSVDDRNYLALITTQSDGEVSEYFKEWILAEGLIKNAVNTDRFITILKTIDLPKDVNGNEIERADFKRQVYDYVRTNKRNRVNIYDISTHFYGEGSKSAMKDFADANNIILDPEFKVTSAKWKSLITIRASVKGIKIDIDYDKINDEDVQVLENKVVIHSKDLAALISNKYQKAQSIDV